MRPPRNLSPSGGERRDLRSVAGRFGREATRGPRVGLAAKLDQMAMESFEGRLVRPEGTGTWTYVDVPAAVSDRLGTPARLPVSGTVAGQPLRSTLMVFAGGARYLVVPRELREAAGVGPGDVVRVELEPDLEPRTVEAPPDLSAALEGTPGASAAFTRLANSHKKAYVDWIDAAKRPETRERRIFKSVDMIAVGKKLKG